MQIIHDLAQAHPASGSCVTVGVFDGIHRGHQQLIAGMIQAAHSTHSTAVAITFDPHPATTLGYESPPLLTTIEERAQLLEKMGLDLLAVLPFDTSMAHTSAADFVAGLVQHLQLVELWGGPDFAFGRQREGNVQFLRQLGAERGFVVRVVEPLIWAGAPVNSSRVRTALREGDIEEATGCLGRPYRMAGVAIPESERQSGLESPAGVSTTNLSLSHGLLIPADGPYACLVHTETLGTHPAVVIIDALPPGPGPEWLVEVYVLNLDADLGHQSLIVDFVARLSFERPFRPFSLLIEQARKKIAQARDRLGNGSIGD
jgi:riboflavin kinase/FMN adenylyltransferase